MYDTIDDIVIVYTIDDVVIVYKKCMFNKELHMIT